MRVEGVIFGCLFTLITQLDTNPTSLVQVNALKICASTSQTYLYSLPLSVSRENIEVSNYFVATLKNLVNNHPSVLV